MRILRSFLPVLAALPVLLQSQILDFQVNETAGPNTCSRSGPVIVPQPGGGSLVLWMDARNGESRLFGQVFRPDGSKTGPNLSFSAPRLEAFSARTVSGDAAGGFVRIGKDESAGSSGLFAQRYRPDGTAVGPLLRVDDDPGGSYKRDFTVACDSAGGFAAAWIDERNGQYDTYMQRFNARGQAVGNNLRLSDDRQGRFSVPPAIVIDNRGDCIVAWASMGSVALTWIAEDGSPFRTVPNAAAGMNLSVCADGQGRVLLAFTTPQIVGCSFRQFSAEGDVLRHDFFPGISTSELPSVSLTGNGSALLAFSEEYDPSDPQMTDVAVIYPWDFTWDFTTVPDTFHVGHRPWGLSTGIAARFREDGACFFAWDGRNGIFAKITDASGESVLGAVKANDDTLNASRLNPSLAVDGHGGFAVAWEDHRGESGVYAKRFDATGRAGGPDTWVDDDTLDDGGRNPEPVFTPDGGFTVFWKGATGRIEARHFDRDAVPTGGITGVNEHVTCSVDPVAGMDSTGRGVVVWEADYNFTGEKSNVCARVCGEDGSPAGPILRVDESKSQRWSSGPDLAVDTDGRFVVVWNDVDRRSTVARLFSREGAPFGPSFAAIPLLEGESIGSSRVLMDGDGRFTVLQTVNKVYPEKRIRAGRFDRGGAPVGESFVLTDGVPFAGADMDADGSAVIVWTTDDGPNLAAQAYGSDWAPRGRPFLLTHGAKMPDYPECSIRMSRGRIYAAWTDCRTPGGGISIWASVTDAASGLAPGAGVPERIFLGSNHPNPFHSGTWIPFELHAEGRVSVRVLDILGRRVRTLVEGRMNAGPHQVRWDGTDDAGGPLPSGVYVFRLEADGTAVQRKSALVR
jgi:hypothetical protein